jgi:hypothetical protein
MRLTGAGRRFIPRVAELETRQLLSQLVVTSNTDSGPGSLRAEIDSASPGEVITFVGTLRGQTITLASPLLVDTNLTIRGFRQVGPTIRGNGATEIFQIASGASVKLAGLKLANGDAARGVAIDNAGNLKIQSSVLVNGCRARLPRVIFSRESPSTARSRMTRKSFRMGKRR